MKTLQEIRRVRDFISERAETKLGQGHVDAARTALAMAAALSWAAGDRGIDDEIFDGLDGTLRDAQRRDAICN